MRFGVLGPLQVWTRSGEPVAIADTKVRALLAVLLLAEGHTVSTDRIVDELWGTTPPGNPLNTLQTRVSQLRRALESAEPGGRSLLVRQPPGYRLAVEPEDVDAGRFAALTARAAQTPDPRSRLSLLGEALQQWRGSVLADFADYSFARRAQTRLAEQRLIAQEDRALARLALGESQDLVAELADLVAAHPRRERLRAAQMRALYRAGRQTEALGAYRELAEHLWDELGVSPGPELTELHRDILKQAPELTVAAAATNLPASRGELIGREAALAGVAAMVLDGRLVTLTGHGGVGKTRLAIETGRRMVGDFPDGVWLVELGSIGPGASMVEVTETVAAALGIRDLPSRGIDTEPRSLLDRLMTTAGTMRALLVLDNCEHVIAPVAKLADLLLRSTPQLRILTTSREALNITGEALWSVEPLPVPSADSMDVADMAEVGAVRLFTERAVQADAGFVLDSGNAARVAEICRRLDGIPLALELAATRVRSLGITDLARRLDDVFAMLSVGRNDAPARQRTLRAVIDWSWQLLTEAEQTLLRRLSIHVDGCTLAAAEAGCAGGAVATGDVVELLRRLVEQSLVVATDSVDGMRYRLWETVAEYGRLRLAEAGETEEVLRRHRRFYRQLAETAAPALRGGDQSSWLRRLDADQGNLRAALAGALEASRPDEALRLANALTWYWYLRCRPVEAVRWLRLALSSGTGPSRERAIASAWRFGLSLIIPGANPALPAGSVAELCAAIDDPAERATAQWFIGSTLFGGGGQAGSEELVEEALATFTEIDDRWGIATALATKATQELFRSDLNAMQQHARRSLEMFEQLGDQWGQLRASQSLSDYAQISGDYALADRLGHSGLRIATELGLRSEVANQLSTLGRTALLTGDHRAAIRLHQEAADIAVKISDQPSEVFARLGLALSARRSGELDSAESQLNSIMDWNRRSGHGPAIALILDELGFIAELRGDAAGAAARHREALTGLGDSGDVRAIALALEGLAGAKTLDGDAELGARLLGAATATRESVAAPLPAAERGDVDRVTARAVTALGEPGFAAAFQSGADSGLDLLPALRNSDR